MRFLCASLLLLCAQVAEAQTTRRWVSGVGDDANPCSRTAPCKSIEGALSKTDAGGEIDVLDPGAYGLEGSSGPTGPITITKAITIDGGAFVSVMPGVIITATGSVTLRNVSINGKLGDGTKLGVGVDLQSGATLTLQNVTLENVSDGLLVSAPSASSVALDGVRISNVSSGIRVASGPSTLLLRDVEVVHATLGLQITGARVSVFNSGFNVSASMVLASQASVDIFKASIRGPSVAFSSNNDSVIRLSQVSAIDVGAVTSLQTGGRVLTFGDNHAISSEGLCNVAESIGPSALPSARVGAAFSATFSYIGGQGDATFSVTSGALPAGVSLTGTTLSGTPTTEGAATFQITGTDAAGCSTIRGYTINVAAADAPPPGPSGDTDPENPNLGDDTPTPPRAGCACGASGSEPALFALVVLALLLRRRWRARS